MSSQWFNQAWRFSLCKTLWLQYLIPIIFNIIIFNLLQDQLILMCILLSHLLFAYWYIHLLQTKAFFAKIRRHSHPKKFVGLEFRFLLFNLSDFLINLFENLFILNLENWIYHLYQIGYSASLNYFPIFLVFYINFANTIDKQGRLHWDYKMSRDQE